MDIGQRVVVATVMPSFKVIGHGVCVGYVDPPTLFDAPFLAQRLPSYPKVVFDDGTELVLGEEHVWCDEKDYDEDVVGD